jgi:hypothetical protein
MGPLLALALPFAGTPRVREDRSIDVWPDHGHRAGNARDVHASAILDAAIEGYVVGWKADTPRTGTARSAAEWLAIVRDIAVQLDWAPRTIAGLTERTSRREGSSRRNQTHLIRPGNKRREGASADPGRGCLTHTSAGTSPHNPTHSGGSRMQRTSNSVMSYSYNSISSEPFGVRKAAIALPRVPLFENDNESGVSVTSYGQGQLTGAMFTVPAHGEIRVDFRLKLLCVTPENAQMLNELIRSLLDATRQHLYDDLKRTEVSGGASFFGLFGWGGAKASYSDTKHTMDRFGLSEQNQQRIVNAMMEIVQQPSEFNYTGTIYNRANDYDVTGNLFGIVMDATIQQSQYQHQLRFLAPEVRLRTPDGSGLPVVGRLYDLQ